VISRDEVRLRELGNFLRTRRARITPEEAGLIVAGRRRAPGLRREDVALLAGVSATWYTWLEQARAVKASIQLLENLARILKLSSIERVQLFQLALGRPPSDLDPRGEEVSPIMLRLLDRIDVPATIVGRRWDILASNRIYRVSFFDFESVPPQERNLLWFFFVNPVSRGLGQWEKYAYEVIARFRVDFGRHAGDPGFVELVERLEQVSPEFAEWWPRQDLRPLVEGKFEWNHPNAGLIAGTHITMAFSENPELRLIAIVPEADSLAKLRAITNQAPSPPPKLAAVKKTARR